MSLTLSRCIDSGPKQLDNSHGALRTRAQARQPAIISPNFNSSQNAPRPMPTLEPVLINPMPALVSTDQSVRSKKHSLHKPCRVSISERYRECAGLRIHDRRKSVSQNRGVWRKNNGHNQMRLHPDYIPQVRTMNKTKRSHKHCKILSRKGSLPARAEQINTVQAASPRFSSISGHRSTIGI